ncbi:hypothetical protein Droror1_Dr00016419 [Drosera rotundifolia]
MGKIDESGREEPTSVPSAANQQDSAIPELSLVAPYVGMEFATVDEAKNYYDEYGKQRGFCTRQRDTKRGIASMITNQVVNWYFVLFPVVACCAPICNLCLVFQTLVLYFGPILCGE